MLPNDWGPISCHSRNPRVRVCWCWSPCGGGVEGCELRRTQSAARRAVRLPQSHSPPGEASMGAGGRGRFAPTHRWPAPPECVSCGCHRPETWRHLYPPPPAVARTGGCGPSFSHDPRPRAPGASVRPRHSSRSAPSPFPFPSVSPRLVKTCDRLVGCR